MRALLFAAIALSGISIATVALADTFVFSVPVRIANAPTIGAGVVDCSVAYARAGHAAGFGDGSSAFTVTGGSYTGTVTVTVTPPPEVHREDLWRWDCYLSLNSVDGTQFNGAGLTPEALRARYTAATGHSVASMLMETQADFPH